jgi:biotin carboxyl carrier protein
MKNEYQYQTGDQVRTVTVERSGDRLLVTLDGVVYQVDLGRSSQHRLDLTVDGVRLTAHVVQAGAKLYLALNGATWVIQHPGPVRRRSTDMAQTSGALIAAMPGQVVRLFVDEGDLVARGDTLAVLEAMKMELRVTAPYAGRVDKVHCGVGDVVDRGQILVALAPLEESL